MGQLSTILRERGHCLTLQREIIIDALESISGHIAVEDIYGLVHGRFPLLNISTVYRTLELLEQEGLVIHVHPQDGVARWHRTDESRHQHIVCDNCRMEAELDYALLEPLARQLREQYGFKARFRHFAVSGLCRDCQRSGADGPAQSPG